MSDRVLYLFGLTCAVLAILLGFLGLIALLIEDFA